MLFPPVPSITFSRRPSLNSVLSHNPESPFIPLLPQAGSALLWAELVEFLGYFPSQESLMVVLEVPVGVIMRGLAQGRRLVHPRRTVGARVRRRLPARPPQQQQQQERGPPRYQTLRSDGGGGQGSHGKGGAGRKAGGELGRDGDAAGLKFGAREGLGMGKRGAKFSEVKPAVGTESSEGVPGGSQNLKCGIHAGDVAPFPRKRQGGVVAGEESCRLPGVASSLDPNPLPGDPNRAPRPGHPPPPPFTLLTTFISLFNSALRSPNRCPIWRLFQPGPASRSYRPRPPTNKC